MRNGYGSSESKTESAAGAAGAGAGRGNGLQPRPDNGLYAYNARLRACGKKLKLIIPKNGGTREGSSGESATESAGGAGGAGEAVFTPGTERRLERLPAMLGAPTHDVYLGGSFPSNCTRPEEMLRREGFSYVIPRANDYTRMFSAPARRSAPAHPESPRTDKKPRSGIDSVSPVPALATSPPPPDDVELRQRTPRDQPADRLSASDFYTVTEDHTPQPFKGTYDEDLLLGSRLLLFSLSAEAPCFSAMVLAAHYMGLRPHATVLLVQPMDVNAAHNYSEAAVKDYNRGRHYLTDLARRTKVPVFESTEEAVTHALRRLREDPH
ncbi:hypothetical protein EVAR_48190_1 [Eumeta japonica]|uniref:Uncharacterized protein n=1 Tax=Eumeta variegata TaxID=151549 RepID=A0A4C1XUR1_EUMVA|nr:hypothetical protein EVAR_48190_1 [Eumeta japonica]